MKKIYTSLIFTLLFFHGFIGFAQDSCSVVIDSVAYNSFQAMPTGISPFTYEWSSSFGSNSDTIYYQDPEPLCVTVTDATGCIATSCYNADNNCTAYLYIDNGLHCAPQGLSPFTYLWSTGETTQSIYPTNIGMYSVTVTSASGCQTIESQELSCNTAVPIIELAVSDSLSADSIIFANIYGTQYGPYTYSWSTGDTTSQITPSSYGQYSVTVTNGIGCTGSNYIDYAASCSVNITETGNSLIANHSGIAPFTYSWNTGESTQSINITASYNSYSVTVTDATNCSASSYFYLPIKSIYGTIDPSGINKRIYLIQLDSAAGTLTAVDSLTSTADSSYFQFYNINAGNYLIKAAQLPLSTPNNNFPTYYSGELFWNDATKITVTNSAPNQEANFSLIQGNNPGGPGFIEGLVSEGAGLLGEGDPIQNQIIHLLNQGGLPVAYTYTDATGHYEFDDIPLGGFFVVLDIQNKAQGNIFVFTSEDKPNAKIDFKVNELEIILANLEYFKKVSFSITPNPAHDQIQINISTPEATHSTITLTDILGNTLTSLNRTLAGKMTISMPIQDLPKGTYFINVRIDNQVLTQKMVKL